MFFFVKKMKLDSILIFIVQALEISEIFIFQEI